MSHGHMNHDQITAIARTIKEEADAEDEAIKLLWEVIQELAKAGVHAYNEKTGTFDCVFCGYSISHHQKEYDQKEYVKDTNLLAICHQPDCLIPKALRTIANPIAQRLMRKE